MPNDTGFRQLTPQEIQSEAIPETWTHPSVLIPLLMGGGAGLRALLARFGQRQTAPMAAEAAQSGFQNLSRPWPGIYQGPMSAGRTIPSPGWTGGGPTTDLSNIDPSMLKGYLESLGGKMLR